MSKFLSLLFIIISNFAYGSAWLQQQNHGYVSLTPQPYIACKSWTKANVLQDTPCFRQFTFEPYIEYGVFSWLTFILDSYFETFNQSGVKRRFNLQNITPTLKFLVWNNNTQIVSLETTYNQPFQSQFFKSSSEEMFDPFFFDGEEQFLFVPTAASAATRASLEKYLDTRVLYGIKSKNPKEYNGWYTNYELGYRKYFDGAADQMHFDWDIGFKTIKQKLTIEFQNKNTFSLRNPKDINFPDYDLFNLIFSVMYDFSTVFALEAGVEQTVFGRNIGMGTSPYITAYFNF